MRSWLAQLTANTSFQTSIGNFRLLFFFPRSFENITEFFTLRDEKCKKDRYSSGPSKSSSFFQITWSTTVSRSSPEQRDIPMRGSNPFWRLDRCTRRIVGFIERMGGRDRGTQQGRVRTFLRSRRKPCCTCDHRLNGPSSSRRRPNIRNIMHGPREPRRSALRSDLSYSNRSIVR